MAVIWQASLLILALVLPNAYAYPNTKFIRPNARKPPFRPGPWMNARATFYGGSDASGTKGGACGYEDPFALGYGKHTVAISTAMFNKGLSCGSCYQIKCAKGTQWCKSGTIVVTATNVCPDGGWCAPPQKHFDLSEPAFLQIAERQAGVVPVTYRRVPCKKQGGIRFMITGNPNFNLVSVTNVGGAGDVVEVKVKGSDNLPWTTLRRNWGQKWETDVQLIDRKLTFRIMTSDTKTITSRLLFPKNWQFGQTYESNRNFGQKHK